MTKKTTNKRAKPISEDQIKRESSIIALVKKFQSGLDVAEELLSYYNNLFNAYIALFSRGDYRINSRSVMSFVKLFMADRKSRNATNKKKIHEDFHNMVNHIKFCMQDLDQQDIEHELKAIFLKLAKNWQPRENIVFSGYISGLYHLYVKDWAKYHMTISYKGKDKEDIEELDSLPHGDDPYSAIVDGVLDEDWVSGYKCSWPFTELTIDEREDLKLLMSDRLSRSEFAITKGYKTLLDVSSRKKFLIDKLTEIRDMRIGL